jgi:hypothetical protein
MHDPNVPRDDAEAAAMGQINLATWRMRRRQAIAEFDRDEGGDQEIRKILSVRPGTNRVFRIR